MNSETSPVTPLQAVEERPQIEEAKELATLLENYMRYEGDMTEHEFNRSAALLRAYAALLQKPDPLHLTDNAGQAKSLQPLLDAQVEAIVDIVDEAQYDPGRSSEYRHGYFDAYKDVRSALRTYLPAALGNRTPARQEERSSEKEVGAAPLPVQGQALAKAQQVVIDMGATATLIEWYTELDDRCNELRAALAAAPGARQPLSDEPKMPPLPEIPPRDCIGYDAIRYVAGYTASYVQQYAINYAEATLRLNGITLAPIAGKGDGNG